MTQSEWLEHLRSQPEHARIFKWGPDLDSLISSLPLSEQQKAREVWESRVGSTIGKILDDQFQSELRLIQPILDDVDLEILSKTHFGLYLTNDFNAWAGHAPTGENRVVVLHEGLPHTLIAWANCYVKFIELGGTSDVKSLCVFPPTISYMASTWNNISHQHPWQRPSTVKNMNLSEELYYAALCFVIAHEIGHIRFDHKGYTNNLTSNHQMEFDADSHGLKVATRFALSRSALYDDSWVYKFSLMAPLFVMSLLSLLGCVDSETHPSARRRLDALIDQQETVFRLVCKDHTDAMLEFLDEDLFEVLARNSRNLLRIATTYTEEVKFSLAGRENNLPPSFTRV